MGKPVIHRLMPGAALTVGEVNPMVRVVVGQVAFHVGVSVISVLT